MGGSNSRADCGFAALLRAHRGAAGLTQEELAARAGLSTEAISTLERGSRRAPRASTVESLATALKLNPELRTEFAAAAAASNRPPAADPDSEAGELTVHDAASRTQNESTRRWFRLRLPLVGGILTLIGALGLLTYLTLSHDAGRQLFGRSDPQPIITNLSVAPSTLHPAPTNYTVISFHLSVDSKVTLTVVDSQGTIVKKLLDDDAKAEGVVSRPYYGYNGATGLPPGNYTVVVTASVNGSTETLKAPLTVVT